MISEYIQSISEKSRVFRFLAKWVYYENPIANLNISYNKVLEAAIMKLCILSKYFNNKIN